MKDFFEDQNIFSRLEDAEFLYQPAEHLVEDVTPWRQSLRYVLLGWLLSAAAIDASFFAQLLSVVGTILLYLGFRSLREENKWFRIGLKLTVLLAVWRAIHFAAACTLWYTAFAAQLPTVLLDRLFWVLTLAILLCAQQGIRTVQCQADTDPDTKHLTLAIGLYVVLDLIPLLGNSDLLLVIRLAAAAALAWCLFKAYRHIGEAGFSIHSAPVKLRKLFVWLIAAGFMLVCTGVGTLFFQQYPMQWEKVQSSTPDPSLRSNLLAMGMPEQVLEDLSEEDLLSLKGVRQVLVGEDFSYDNEPEMTTILVELADGWRVIHHFRWHGSPFYRGTEALELFYSEAYQNYTGQVLYNDGDTTQISPYFQLKSKVYTNSYYATRENTSVYAAFSFPWGAENCRGYVMYDGGETAPAHGDFRYFYQKSPIILQRIQDVLTYHTNGTSISESDPYFTTRYGRIRFVDRK